MGRTVTGTVVAGEALGEHRGTQLRLNHVQATGNSGNGRVGSFHGVLLGQWVVEQERGRQCARAQCQRQEALALGATPSQGRVPGLCRKPYTASSTSWCGYSGPGSTLRRWSGWQGIMEWSTSE